MEGDYIDFRNVVVHDYADLDLEIVWEIVQTNVPLLLQQINEILIQESSLE
ncbi:MAG: DUF86 domain-containing protein [Pseudomonadales bacterium]|nr:DUF86 domain-containing protein [Candidatus Woesebacteria bacterium]MCB9802381.1 DUF86 domain-containing protein [Pseudomonadales bacterium]